MFASMKLVHLLLVFAAGGLGSALRFAIAYFMNKNIPYGTLLVNLLGSFVIGFVLAAYQAKSISEEYRLLFAVGFAGGFSTFSAFVFELHKALLERDFTLLFFYGFGSVFLGLLMVALGWFLGEKLS